MSNLVNIAHAKGSNTNDSNGQVSIKFNGNPSTTLEVVKTATLSEVVVGDTFDYIIKITNTGLQTATGVVLTDNAPQHISFTVSGVTSVPQGTIDLSSTSSYIKVNIGDLTSGTTVTVTIPSVVI